MQFVFKWPLLPHGHLRVWYHFCWKTAAIHAATWITSFFTRDLTGAMLSRGLDAMWIKASLGWAMGAVVVVVEVVEVVEVVRVRGLRREGRTATYLVPSRGHKSMDPHCRWAAVPNGDPAANIACPFCSYCIAWRPELGRWLRQRPGGGRHAGPGNVSEMAGS